MGVISPFHEKFVDSECISSPEHLSESPLEHFREGLSDLNDASLSLQRGVDRSRENAEELWVMKDTIKIIKKCIHTLETIFIRNDWDAD